MGKQQHAYKHDKERIFSVDMKPRRRKINKVYLQFDEEARKEFLTGFRKRKNERRKKAQEEIISTLKEEKRRIRRQKREEMKSRVKEYKDLQDVDTVTTPESYDLASHTVTVTDVSNVNFVGEHGLMLGANLVYEVDNEEDKDDSDKSKAAAAKKLKPWKKKRTNFSHKMDKHSLAKAKRKSKRETAFSGSKWHK